VSIPPEVVWWVSVGGMAGQVGILLGIRWQRSGWFGKGPGA